MVHMHTGKTHANAMKLRKTIGSLTMKSNLAASHPARLVEQDYFVWKTLILAKETVFHFNDFFQWITQHTQLFLVVAVNMRALFLNVYM